MVPAKAKIHSSLETDALAPAHLVMGKNVIRHGCDEFTAKLEAYSSICEERRGEWSIERGRPAKRSEK